MRIITSYSILRIYCPKCNYYFLVDGNCINDYYKCNKCGFELNKTIKENFEDYKNFIKTYSKIGGDLIKNLDEKTRFETYKELDELLHLYNKKAIAH